MKSQTEHFLFKNLKTKKNPILDMKRLEEYLLKITDDDMELISAHIDFYGQNIYNGRCVCMEKCMIQIE